MIPKDLKTSIIIPTYNRPEELQNCIASILKQAKIPDELIIVDDGNLAEYPFRQELEAKGIKCLYLKKETPGLTASRNEGIKSAAGDIIFFFDDDVVLDPCYIEEILKAYQNDRTDEIGGVSGTVTNRTVIGIKDILLWVSEVLFVINGFNEGKVLPSGFCVDYGTTPFRIRKRSMVDFLPGCAMSFRRKVFKEFSFDNIRYLGYGLGEDKDFSFRVSRKYKLIIYPEAKLLHLASLRMRSDKMAMSRKYVISNYIFFANFRKNSWWNLILFSFAVFGYLIIRTFMFFVYPKGENFRRLRGIIAGIRDILTNKQLTT